MVLHIRKALKVRVHQISGSLKDRFAIAQLKLRGDRRSAALQVSVILATSHKETLPADELVSLVLQARTGSRMCVSDCVNLLMERLNKTKSWVVAFKCLTLIHKAIHHGGFIYQDQLSFHPKNGGRNYLNLSRFRDRSSPFAWEASSWVRWYANFLEALMGASKCSCISLDSNSKLSATERVLGLPNTELMAAVLSLSALLHEFCSCPLKSGAAATHTLIRDAFELIVADCIIAQKELQSHIKEICQRLNDLTTSQISELLRVCESLTSESELLMQLTDLAFAMQILRPHQGLDRNIFTDDDLVHFKKALMTSRVSDKLALVTTPPVRKDLSNGSKSSVKLSPPLYWTSTRLSQRPLQSAIVSRS